MPPYMTKLYGSSGWLQVSTRYFTGDHNKIRGMQKPIIRRDYPGWFLMSNTAVKLRTGSQLCSTAYIPRRALWFDHIYAPSPWKRLSRRVKTHIHTLKIVWTRATVRAALPFCWSEINSSCFRLTGFLDPKIVGACLFFVLVIYLFRCIVYLAS